MIRRQVKSKVVNFAVNRRMPISSATPSLDAGFWIAQIEQVARMRDTACFMRIYDHFAPRLNRYLLGLTKNQEAADELVQEAMLRVWAKAASYDPARSNLVTWIFRIARNLCIDRLRNESHWCAIEEGIAHLDDKQTPFEMSSTESFNDGLILLSAINALPVLEARLVRMSYLEAKSHSELASELGMPLGSVKSALRRAFGKLQLSIRNTP